MSKLIARFIFKIAGWKITGNAPQVKKCVMIAVPHTSNWDFIYALCAWKLYGFSPRYLIKKEFYVFPLNIFFYATGGLPVDRSKSNSLTESIVHMFNEKESLITLIPPEGTRQGVDRWKTGFYYVALHAKVPIVLARIDYKKKETYLSDLFWPTGDIEADFIFIKNFYKDVSPKHPKGFNVESIKPS